MKTTIALIILSLTLQYVTAQQSSIDDRELLVEKEYTNEIYEVNPIFDYASILTPTQSPFTFSDSLSRINLFTPDLDVTIQPVAFESVQAESIHKGFLKMDKGTLNPFHTQAHYVYSAANYYNVYAGVNYDKRNEADVLNKNIKEIKANLGMDYYLTNSLKSKVELTIDNNTYGLFSNRAVNADNWPTEESGYNVITGKVSLQTFKSYPKEWNFGIQGEFSNWKNDNDLTERNIYAIGKVEWKWSDSWGLYFLPAFSSSHIADGESISVITSSLRLIHNGSSFYLKSGVRMNYFHDEMFLFPDAEVRWNINKETVLNIRAMAEGLIRGNQNLSTLNPYVTSIKDGVINYRKTIDADIAGEIGPDVGLNIKIGYLQATDDINFITDSEDIRRFTLESVDFDRLRFSIEANRYFLSRQFNLALSVTHDNYTPNMSTLLHRPTWFFAPSIRGNFFNDKLVVAIVGNINNPQTLDNTTGNFRSEWRRDISASLSLNFHQNISIHFDADNIFDTDYQVWNGYNNFGRNLSGGVVVKF